MVKIGHGEAFDLSLRVADDISSHDGRDGVQSDIANANTFRYIFKKVTDTWETDVAGEKDKVILPGLRSDKDKYTRLCSSVYVTAYSDFFVDTFNPGRIVPDSALEHCQFYPPKALNYRLYPQSQILDCFEEYLKATGLQAPKKIQEEFERYKMIRETAEEDERVNERFKKIVKDMVTEFDAASQPYNSFMQASKPIFDWCDSRLILYPRYLMKPAVIAQNVSFSNAYEEIEEKDLDYTAILQEQLDILKANADKGQNAWKYYFKYRSGIKCGMPKIIGEIVDVEAYDKQFVYLMRRPENDANKIRFTLDQKFKNDEINFEEKLTKLKIFLDLEFEKLRGCLAKIGSHQVYTDSNSAEKNYLNGVKLLYNYLLHRRNNMVPVSILALEVSDRYNNIY
ncbi:hypothetical protein HELRODRAFT_183273, partial [Helobdella robusta]|uniref:Uncharacterized protein n=1 Tax=Helobdella robusta TaxID=6412 RepID=T1FJE4_HELRO